MCNKALGLMNQTLGLIICIFVHHLIFQGILIKQLDQLVLAGTNNNKLFIYIIIIPDENQVIARSSKNP